MVHLFWKQSLSLVQRLDHSFLCSICVEAIPVSGTATRSFSLVFHLFGTDLCIWYSDYIIHSCGPSVWKQSLSLVQRLDHSVLCSICLEAIPVSGTATTSFSLAFHLFETDLWLWYSDSIIQSCVPSVWKQSLSLVQRLHHSVLRSICLKPISGSGTATRSFSLVFHLFGTDLWLWYSDSIIQSCVPSVWNRSLSLVQRLYHSVLCSICLEAIPVSGTATTSFSLVFHLFETDLCLWYRDYIIQSCVLSVWKPNLCLWYRGLDHSVLCSICLEPISVSGTGTTSFSLVFQSVWNRSLSLVQRLDHSVLCSICLEAIPVSGTATTSFSLVFHLFETDLWLWYSDSIIQSCVPSVWNRSLSLVQRLYHSVLCSICLEPISVSDTATRSFSLVFHLFETDLCLWYSDYIIQSCVPSVWKQSLSLVQRLHHSVLCSICLEPISVSGTATRSFSLVFHLFGTDLCLWYSD